MSGTARSVVREGYDAVKKGAKGLRDEVVQYAKDAFDVKMPRLRMAVYALMYLSGILIVWGLIELAIAGDNPVLGGRGCIFYIGPSILAGAITLFVVHRIGTDSVKRDHQGNAEIVTTFRGYGLFLTAAFILITAAWVFFFNTQNWWLQNNHGREYFAGTVDWNQPGVNTTSWWFGLPGGYKLYEPQQYVRFQFIQYMALISCIVKLVMFFICIYIGLWARTMNSLSALWQYGTHVKNLMRKNKDMGPGDAMDEVDVQTDNSNTNLQGHHDINYGIINAQHVDDIAGSLSSDHRQMVREMQRGGSSRYK